jgi:hypothetical protein
MKGVSERMKVLFIDGTGLISEAVSRPDYIDGLLGDKMEPADGSDYFSL